MKDRCSVCNAIGEIVPDEDNNTCTFCTRHIHQVEIHNADLSLEQKIMMQSFHYCMNLLNIRITGLVTDISNLKFDLKKNLDEIDRSISREKDNEIYK
jgi:hypothetical protein